MKRNISSIKIEYILLLCLVLFPSLMRSQDINIKGIVVNSNQVPVSNVLVSLKSNPDFYCYTNENGEFTLTNTSTNITENNSENSHIMKLPDGSMQVQVKNEPFTISVEDLLGRNQKKETYNNRTGRFKIYPEAFLNNLSEGIYIVSIRVDNEQQSSKYTNINKRSFPKGVTLISEAFEENIDNKKLLKSNEDLIVLEHDFYKITKVFISNLNSDIGTIELENFGNYTLAENVDPGFTTLYRNEGTFIDVFGKDSSQFILKFDAYSIPKDEVILVAIPVDEFDFLPESFQLISGIHLEPAGSHFGLPVLVDIKLKNITPTNNLLVFLYDKEKDKICYLPYNVIENLTSNDLAFFISHFSDLGLVVTDNPISAFNLTPEEIPEDGFVDSDDAMSFIKYKVLLEHEVTDEVFEVWYNSVIKSQIEGISNFESFGEALSEFGLMAQYAQYANKDIEEFVFYGEALAKLSEKSREIMEQINAECNEQTDECLLREMAKIGNQLVALTQAVPWVDDLNIDDICSGIMNDMVDVISYDNGFITLQVNETKQLPIRLLNINLEEVTAELSFRSEDDEIVRVSENGEITGLKRGLAKVFITHCELEIFVYVSVEHGNFCDTDPSPDSNTYSAKFAFSARYKTTTTRHTSHWKVELEINMATHMYEGSYKMNTIYSYKVFSEWKTTYSSQSGKLGMWDVNTAYCNNKGFLYTDDYGSIGKIYIYPQARKAKIQSITFFDRYLSPSATLVKTRSSN